jgi:DNA-3-methyladenine glycosylase
MNDPVKLPLSFYRRDNVVRVARELLGKILVTRWKDQRTSGRIVEVEAYEGIIDRASHAYAGRKTARNEIMYREGGFAYVYLCYGIHHLFNVVTHSTGIPHAVLVRALEPLEGIDIMLKRTGKSKADHTLTRGPGNLSKAMGITTRHTGFSLLSDHLFIADDGFTFKRSETGSSPRIGVQYAGAHAEWPYRYYVKGNPYVSGKPR